MKNLLFLQEIFYCFKSKVFLSKKYIYYKAQKWFLVTRKPSLTGKNGCFVTIAWLQESFCVTRIFQLTKFNWCRVFRKYSVTGSYISCLKTKFPVTGRDVGLLLKQKIIFTYKRIVFPLQIKVIGRSKTISSDTKDGSLIFKPLFLL